jgi:hypothetical protein
MVAASQNRREVGRAQACDRLRAPRFGMRAECQYRVTNTLILLKELCAGKARMLNLPEQRRGITARA